MIKVFSIFSYLCMLTSIFNLNSSDENVTRKKKLNNPPRLVNTTTVDGGWNMVHYNLTNQQYTYEIFDPSSYTKRTRTPQAPSTYNLTNTEEQSYDLDEIVGDDYIKTTTVNGVEYQYTEGYTPQDTQMTRGVNGVYGEDDRTLITNPKTPPYYKVGLLVCAFADEEGNGTTTFSTAFFMGPNVLATAAHCVYTDVTNDGVVNPILPGTVWFFPGLNGDGDMESLMENGEYAEGIAISLNREYYYNPSVNTDWAVIEINRDMGYIVGWNGKIANFYSQNYPVESYGYPSSGNGYMYRTTGTMYDKTNYFYKLTVDGTEGQSGSPLMVDVNNEDFVCGILTHYNVHPITNVTNYVGATILTQLAFSYFNSFVTGTIEVPPDC